jgi:hypothetical protein
MHIISFVFFICISLPSSQEKGGVFDNDTKRNFDYCFLFEYLYEIQQKVDIMKPLSKTSLCI